MQFLDATTLAVDRKTALLAVGPTLLSIPSGRVCGSNGAVTQRVAARSGSTKWPATASQSSSLA